MALTIACNICMRVNHATDYTHFYSCCVLANGVGDEEGWHSSNAWWLVCQAHHAKLSTPPARAQPWKRIANNVLGMSQRAVVPVFLHRPAAGPLESVTPSRNLTHAVRCSPSDIGSVFPPRAHDLLPQGPHRASFRGLPSLVCGAL